MKTTFCLGPLSLIKMRDMNLTFPWFLLAKCNNLVNIYGHDTHTTQSEAAILRTHDIIHCHGSKDADFIVCL